MALEVWWGSGSTPAWRVQLGLALKKVPYESHLLSFSAGDTRTPEFRAISPRGKVPLVSADGPDGKFFLNESLAILAWLDRTHPEPPLFGRTPEETGQIWRWCLEHENHAATTVGAAIRPIFTRPGAVDEIRAAVPAMHEEVRRLEAAVEGGRPLVGAAISAADLVWYCGMALAMRGATRPAAASLDLGLRPLGEHYPSIAAWAQRIEAIPGYAETVPPHWREGDAPFTGLGG